MVDRIPCFSRMWALLCSLKLAIVLASAATLLVIGGSLLLPFHPQLFAPLDEMILHDWIVATVPRAAALTWWVPGAGLLVILLGLNTLCCLIDWLCHLRARWRKTGEYLIHLGFVLILGAFLWGSLTGFRSAGQPLLVGQSIALTPLDLVLRLDALEPVLNEAGRPVDMTSTLVLVRGQEVLRRVETRVNKPLIWRGLVVIPTSAGQASVAGRMRPYSLLIINHDPGAGVALGGAILMGCGVLLTMVSFYRKRQRGDHPDIA
ncbi:MAG: cytochrome c biogenesis protein ResB [Pelovirga sp.]